MVAIRPFRALRYNMDRVEDLSRVVAPPYDIINPEEQEALYQTSPYNVVRLTLGKQYPDDTQEENRYTRSRRDFAAWRENRVLTEDAAPALYLVEHAFESGAVRGTRLGFVALMELNEAAGRGVYRHEATLAAPKEDRTKLLQAIPANLEPIFCVYPDEGAALQSRLVEATHRSPPSGQAVLKGETVRFWALTDGEAIDEVTRHLASAGVLIADGHHRFEVAYANRSQYSALMTYFVSMEDPGLIVRPIHRVVTTPEPPPRAALERVGRLEPVTDLAALLRWLEEPGEDGCFGYADRQGVHRVTVEGGQRARWLMTPPVPLPVASLDVSLLHGLILPSLNVQPGSLQYTADAARALRLIQQGQVPAAWFLRALPLKQVYALAAQGFTLPPKSTYFYPKIPSGLTINLLA